MESRLELITKYKNDEKLMPVRGTEDSAGYDLRSAEDIVIPSLWKLLDKITIEDNALSPFDLESTQAILKELGVRPTLVPTGVRIKLPKDKYAGVHARSSLPLKHMLIVANDEGIIDSDYYYADNEGHIHVMLLNISPFDIQIRKYDKLAQLIVKDYYKVVNDNVENKKRTEGFGHTGN